MVNARQGGALAMMIPSPSVMRAAAVRPSATVRSSGTVGTSSAVSTSSATVRAAHR